MTDGTELELIGVERRDRLLRVCGYAAVTTFCAVSFGANLQYGLSLGKTPIDKTTYAAASVAARALARLLGLEEVAVRTGIALLLAGLIEAGSALGFTLVSMATGQNQQPTTPLHYGRSGPSYTARPSGRGRPFSSANFRRRGGPQTRHRGAPPGHQTRGRRYGSRRGIASTDAHPRQAPRSVVDAPTNTEWRKVIERWVQIRLNTDTDGSIPAREAYTDFCRWARSASMEPCTETRFGRLLSALVVQLGGSKMKKRDRTYYQGLTFRVKELQAAA